MHLNRKAIVSGILVLIAAVLLSACGTTSGPSAVKSEAKGSAVLVDKAVWQSQSPEDGTHIDAGAEFDITWFMTNTGTTTWTTDYSLRYFAGTNLMKPGKRLHIEIDHLCPVTQDLSQCYRKGCLQYSRYR